MTKVQARFLDGLLDYLLAEFSWVDRIVFLYEEIEGFAEMYKDRLLFTQSECSAHLDRNFDKLKRFKDARLYHFSLCTVPTRLWPHVWNTLAGFKVTWLDGCRTKCVYRDQCVGVHRSYVKHCGAPDIEPITAPRPSRSPATATTPSSLRWRRGPLVSPSPCARRKARTGKRSWTPPTGSSTAPGSSSTREQGVLSAVLTPRAGASAGLAADFRAAYASAAALRRAARRARELRAAILSRSLELADHVDARRREPPPALTPERLAEIAALLAEADAAPRDPLGLRVPWEERAAGAPNEDFRPGPRVGAEKRLSKGLSRGGGAARSAAARAWASPATGSAGASRSRPRAAPKPQRCLASFSTKRCPTPGARRGLRT